MKKSPHRRRLINRYRNATSAINADTHWNRLLCGAGWWLLMVHSRRLVEQRDDLCGAHVFHSACTQTPLCVTRRGYRERWAQSQRKKESLGSLIYLPSPTPISWLAWLMPLAHPHVGLHMDVMILPFLQALTYLLSTICIDRGGSPWQQEQDT